MSSAKRKLPADALSDNNVDRERLQSLLTIPDPDASADEAAVEQHFQQHFARIADALLNRTLLRISDESRGILPQWFRFLEVEFYLKDQEWHLDPYTHGQPQQKTRGQWYFHKKGNAYSGGTWKGVDLTFGETKDTHCVFGGILIRAIECCETGEIVEGPSRCVDRLIEVLKAKGVPDLADGILQKQFEATGDKAKLALVSDRTLARLWKEDGGPDGSPNGAAVGKKAKTELSDTEPDSDPEPEAVAQPPKLKAAAGDRPSQVLPCKTALGRRLVLGSPRIGLYLRASYSDLDQRIGYVRRPYRFFSRHQELKRSKPLTVLASLRLVRELVNQPSTVRDGQDGDDTEEDEPAEQPRPGSLKDVGINIRLKKADLEYDREPPQALVNSIHRLSNVPTAMVARCLASYRQGQGQAAKSFLDDALGSADSLCRFFGCVGYQ
ncbi:uncharacterized protein BJ171DRAFT_576763 [Polychytrium aggregatum]|uniref:uncharacterized protein n=1 Tax=Polychytrium aggregatum TaxID=110093 RepID=UPI0022FF2F3E|nr:uncharacterized protein BJ171DRAFT_576763 [Polychytrium aggregatum]KAI9209181.1 hypothetical protein BJ171DRAFT_576763 [Polychytrium aggregatum]